MKVLRYISGLLLCFFILFCSCKKETTSKRYKDLISLHIWKLDIELYQQPPDSSALVITRVNFNACDLGRHFQFKSDGRFVYTQNGNCYSDPNNIFNKLDGGGWNIPAGDSMLIITNGFYSQNFYISILNLHAMLLQKKSSNYFQQKEVYTYSFSPAF